MRVLLLSCVLAGCAAKPAPAAQPVKPAPTLVVPEPAETEVREREESLPEREESQSLPSGLRLTEMRRGSGAVAEPGKRIVVHYVGTLDDGSVFDSTRERGTPFEVDLGKGYLIKGFEEGVVGMRVGGLRRLIIPPELGYGDRATAKIPASSVLVFEIELLEVR